MRQPARKKKVLPPPRVRKEPPTIEEAVSAARDITDDLEQQVSFAAGLMDVGEDEVRPLVMRALAERPPRGTAERIIPVAGRDNGFGARRVVVVERRPLRRTVGSARA